MLFQPGDIALGNAQHVCNLLLCIFVCATKAKPKLHDLLFTRGELTHCKRKQFLIHLILNPAVNEVAIRAENIGKQKNRFPIPIDVKGLIQGNLELEAAAPTQELRESPVFSQYSGKHMLQA